MHLTNNLKNGVDELIEDQEEVLIYKIRSIMNHVVFAVKTVLDILFYVDVLINIFA